MMQAKVQVTGVTQPYTGAEEVRFAPVCGNKPFGANGESDDNTFSRWTPSGDMRLVITNPELAGKFKVGDKFYVQFTPAPDEQAAPVVVATDGTTAQ